MTEAEWLTGNQLGNMLGLLIGTAASDRKLRLFSCSCFLHLARSDDFEIDLVALSERFADGRAEITELQKARSQLGAAGGYTTDWAASNARFAILADSASEAAADASDAVGSFFYILASKHSPYGGGPESQAARDAEHRSQASLLNDIFGNPFRPVAFDPAWRTATVTSLAQAIYADRRFADLPILADALEDAGCTSADVLEHCRTPGEHVRGCWVVDLVLGKS